MEENCARFRTGRYGSTRQSFLRKLLLNKLIRREELGIVPTNILIFPMDFENAMNTICNRL